MRRSVSSAVASWLPGVDRGNCQHSEALDSSLTDRAVILPRTLTEDSSGFKGPLGQRTGDAVSSPPIEGYAFMTADTVPTKRAALVAFVSLFGLVAMLGCQTSRQRADAVVARSPATNTAAAPLPSTSFNTTAPRSEWPRMITIPSGASMIVALQTRLRTDANKAGESFRANLTEAVRVDQLTVLPAGTEVRGQLTLVEEPHRITGKAQMTLESTNSSIPPEICVRSRYRRLCLSPRVTRSAMKRRWHQALSSAV